VAGRNSDKKGDRETLGRLRNRRGIFHRGTSSSATLLPALAPVRVAFPPVYMVLAPKFRVWFWAALVIALPLAGAPPPLPVPIRNLPPDLSSFTNAIHTPRGWVALTTNSLVLDVGVDRPATVLRPPSSGELRLLLSFQDGLIVGGDSAAYFFKNDAWRRLDIDDNLYAGVHADDGILLVGGRAIYRLAPDLSVQQLERLTTARLPHAQAVRGVPHVFAGRDGVFRWENGKMRPANDEFPWAARSEVASIQELPDGTLFAPSNRGLFRIREREATRINDPVFERSIREAILHASILGDMLVVATYLGGVTAYSLATNEELWRITPEQLGGSVAFATRVDDSFLIGTSAGLHVLPDPTRYTFSPLPVGDVTFAARSDDGPLIGLTTTVHNLRTGEKVAGAAVTSALQLHPGKLLFGELGLVRFGEKHVKIPGRHVTAIAPLDVDTVVVLQPHGATVVNEDGSHLPLTASSTPTSVAAGPDGTVLLGTSSGALVFDAQRVERGRFGTGLTKVYTLPTAALAFDGAGRVFDHSGRHLASVPYAEVLDVIEWREHVMMLARFADGSSWVGRLDLAAGAWKPLDLPLPFGPAKLISDGDSLFIVAPRMVLRTRHTPPLAAPDVSQIRVSSRGVVSTARRVELEPHEDTIEILFPAPRLPPWRNPSYSLQLNGVHPDEALPGAAVRLSRLYWGESKVTTRAEWGGLSTTSDVQVFRKRPWWMRPPAYALYAAAATLFAYVILKIRTQQLERRAKRLQEMVDERTAELRQAQKAREEFFSTLSHEIRNPLNGVVGICEILDEASTQAIAPRERIFVRTLRGCADQLRSILDDVLDFARIDRGEIQVHNEPFELLSAVEGAVRATDAQLAHCRLELPPGPVWVSGDGGKLRQVVTNLVSNALKYGVPPEAHVRVEVNSLAGEKTGIRISVVNTGPTIPAEELERIFTGFTRGSDAVKRRIAGTGIGLAVSRRIAQALGGTLAASSENGRTEFLVTLALPPAAPLNSDDERIPTNLNSRALAIEDEQYNRLVLGHILSRMGYEVDWAADGATAIERIRTGSYDLILTDYSLPDIDGVELAKKMLAELPEPKPPIVAVTAYSTPEKIQQGREAGIAGFVTKPVSRKKLEAAILGIAPRARMRQSLDVEEGEACDFTPLLRIPNGKQLVAQYAAELPEAWERLATDLQSTDWQSRAESLSRQVHAFRSRLLAVRASVAAEQVSLLEEAVRNKQRHDVERLVSAIAPIILDLTEAARRRAIS
jgi:signal transduction histidine kinase/CheY-like chemotaxis protein